MFLFGVAPVDHRTEPLSADFRHLEEMYTSTCPTEFVASVVVKPKARLSLTHAKITSLAHAYVTCTCKSFYYITCTCTHLLGGVVGVGGMVTFLGLAHILECGWWAGRVGWVGGMITFLGLAHILVYGCGGMGGVGWGGWDDIVPWTCKHTSLRVVGWGGWDDNVPWTCTHTSLRVVGGWGGWGDNVLGSP